MTLEQLEAAADAATEKLRKAVIKKFPVGSRVKTPHGQGWQYCVVRGHRDWGDIDVYLTNERTGTNLSRHYCSLSHA